MRKAVLLLLSLLICPTAGPAAAQNFVGIGTDPMAPTELVNAGNFADWRSQTFISHGAFLRSLSFWFHGGTRYSSLDDDFYTRLYINTGFGFCPEGHLQVFRAALDHRVSGRYDFYFNALRLVPGSPYTFSIFTNNCGPSCGTDNPPGGGPPITGFHQNPRVEVTMTDAYGDGYFIRGRSGPIYDRDMRFEATFVPEPSTSALMCTGLLGLGFLVWRRREQEAD